MASTKLRVTIATFFFVLCFLPSRFSPAAERPNIVLVMADDMGWGDLPCYRSDSKIHAPNLTAMANNGLRFDRFYSAAPVCSPTRGSCLTGRHPYRYGVYTANKGHLKPKEITLPEILKQNGYRTGHFGKWHLGTLTTEVKDANRGGPRNKQHFSPPRQHGYDVCLVTESKVPTYDPLLKPVDANRRAWDALTDRSLAVSYGTRYWNENGQVVMENMSGDDSRIIMDRAIPFIVEAANDKQPFFVVVWFHAPHLPVVADPKHVNRYKSESVYDRNYYGCITALDEQVGRLRDTLRQLNITDNTMLWFCSDNGPEGKDGAAPGSAGGLRGRKRSLYEGGVRVPGILEWPAKVAAGRSTQFPAVTSDYLPTILDALDLNFPSKRPLDGVSLLPMLKGIDEFRHKPIGFQAAKQCSYVGHQHKVISQDAGVTWELYDISVDRNETTNLAEQQPARLKQMVAAFSVWSESCRQSDAGADYAK
jgi:arylsulfatase A-like enzyme